MQDWFPHMDNTVNHVFFFFFCSSECLHCFSRTPASDIWHFLKISSDISWCFIILDDSRRHFQQLEVVSGECETVMSKWRSLTQRRTLDPIYQHGQVKDSSLSVVKALHVLKSA